MLEEGKRLEGRGERERKKIELKCVVTSYKEKESEGEWVGEGSFHNTAVDQLVALVQPLIHTNSSHSQATGQFLISLDPLLHKQLPQ